MTETASAQLTNFVTNPQGNAWHTTDGSQAADLCSASAWADGYRLTSLWSNCQQACVPFGTMTFDKQKGITSHGLTKGEIIATSVGAPLIGMGLLAATWLSCRKRIKRRQGVAAA